jgi:hypothetical protein
VGFESPCKGYERDSDNSSTMIRTKSLENLFNRGSLVSLHNTIMKAVNQK